MFGSVDSPGGAFDGVLAGWEGDGRLTHVSTSPGRTARYAGAGHSLPARIGPLANIPLWCHQAEAVEGLVAGRHTVIATGTASGKSLCYQAAIAHDLTAEGGGGTSLLIYPTKALAQDQLRSLGEAAIPGLWATTFDGDSNPGERTWARDNANAVLTNPEMVHYSLLPHHHRWSSFLRRLNLVVIDELHLLRGTFGTQVAHVVRRLRRIAAHYGADPTFCFTSATIGGPAELASAVCGAPVQAVEDDGSPLGPRTLAVWNPFTPESPEEFPSVNAAAAGWAERLITAGHRTLVFARSRKGVELIWQRLSERLPAELADQVRPYRSGYLAEERRGIESELFGDRLRGVIATTALELGIDVGGLDAVVCAGFPGTISSFRQQTGRSGRGAGPSLSVLVCGEDQLDQWLARHPRDLLSRPCERSLVNPANPWIMEPHLRCAAAELPLRTDDDRWWGGALDEGVRDLVELGELRLHRPSRPDQELTATWAGRGNPHSDISLRGGGGRVVEIVTDDNTVIGTIDGGRAPGEVHEGAIYLHLGRTWRVEHLDLDRGRAVVAADPGDTYTMARSVSDVNFLHRERCGPLGTGSLSLALVEITGQVVGYQRRSTSTHEIIDNISLDLPVQRLVTRAVVYTLDGGPPPGLATSDLPGALHAAEHAAIGMLPLFALCDRWDLGGLSTPSHPQTGVPTVIIHEATPGGIGISEVAASVVRDHLGATRSSIAACPCVGGCPSCIQSPKCGNLNEPLHKAGAVALLDLLTGGDLHGPSR